ncbi:NUDIX hydrolase [Macrococcus hajekii]|uniref:NUDIX hydrolase n=1 Tax=Macrococcus hajekii TaxID=198482 RepID=A0A4R6BI34_9STAP|nr:NUDIX hydrolase [Macrococcus hajekii]TDM01181.1 NUDIX hydrolase [Macrococcus hajekii]GGB11897.1 NUDIX hydrolase [Macrococcus hajekii]
MKKHIDQHDYNIFKINTIQMSLNDKVGQFYQIVPPDWVNIIAFHKGQLIMERQFRIGVEEQVLELPAGIIEKNEDIVQAAERELLEETGYSGRGQLIGTLIPNPAIQTNRCHTVLIPETCDTGQSSPDTFETIETLLMTEEQVKKAIRSGEIQNALHLASLYQYQLYY